jgi:hypothetical protein
VNQTKNKWAVKDRYWLMLAVTASLALFCFMKARIDTEDTLLRQALTDAGSNLPYQLIVYNNHGGYYDTIYTNDYTLSPATHGNTDLNDLHVRWGVTWCGTHWLFMLQPVTLEDVKVTVNTGNSIEVPVSF